MATILEMGGTEKSGLSAGSILKREELAAQIVAVMQAHFSRPGPQEMREILRSAEGQITALELAPSTQR